MKTRLIFLLPLLWVLTGCSDSESSDTATLKVSETSFKNISANGETITVNIQSNHKWNISSNNSWCTTDITSGENNGKIRIEVNKNSEAYARAATITVETDGQQEKVSVIQDGKQLSGEEIENHHYKIPVVFQVLYKDPNNTIQNMRASRASDLIVACNKYYQNLLESASVDMNLEFVLAARDPEGNILQEAGINRTQINEATMDCEKFMENKDNLKYLWDTDRYINIMLYTFSNENILGISHLPYTIAPDKLDGLNQLDFLPEHSNLTYPHCVSINNKYIYSSASIENRTYNSVDVIPTIAHELGHYLGLFHAFSEPENKETGINTCIDSDYCDDTPTYDRDAYITWMSDYIISKNGITNMSQSEFNKLFERLDCVSETVSIPNNIMDYDISWLNRFTNDQRNRVRHMLARGVLIPGPKETRVSTRATGPQNFPMRMIK